MLFAGVSITPSEKAPRQGRLIPLLWLNAFPLMEFIYQKSDFYSGIMESKSAFASTKRRKYSAAPFAVPYSGRMNYMNRRIAKLYKTVG